MLRNPLPTLSGLPAQSIGRHWVKTLSSLLAGEASGSLLSPQSTRQHPPLRVNQRRLRLSPLLYRLALLGLLGSWVVLMVHHPVAAEVLVLKQGEIRQLPILQTRARVPIQALEMLYLGMLEDRFLDYANNNNWQTITATRDTQEWTRWQLLPGGEAIYRSPHDDRPIYARGFLVQAYFEKSRLIGMHLIRNPDEPGFDLPQLKQLIQAWFPDNRILLRYQALPDDPSQQVITAYLGNVPAAFISDLGRTQIPFCQTFLTPNTTLPLLPPLQPQTPQCFSITGSASQAHLNSTLFLVNSRP
ncbi:MAG: hypothetical protein NW237_13850 [Cyanobacteriota bacterium]|nr:hypothetical protein [Cyanobacteriota bacterium]